jgi:hypothetical protein
VEERLFESLRETRGEPPEEEEEEEEVGLEDGEEEEEDLLMDDFSPEPFRLTDWRVFGELDMLVVLLLSVINEFRTSLLLSPRLESEEATRAMAISIC